LRTSRIYTSSLSLRSAHSVTHENCYLRACD
jgi:hypothetical protein